MRVKHSISSFVIRRIWIFFSVQNVENSFLSFPKGNRQLVEEDESVSYSHWSRHERRISGANTNYNYEFNFHDQIKQLYIICILTEDSFISNLTTNIIPNRYCPRPDITWPKSVTLPRWKRTSTISTRENSQPSQTWSDTFLHRYVLQLFCFLSRIFLRCVSGIWTSLAWRNGSILGTIQYFIMTKLFKKNIAHIKSGPQIVILLLLSILV